MIIYSLVCNEGGMLRVVESLENLFLALPDDFPLRVFIFSSTKPKFIIDERFVWFPHRVDPKKKWLDEIADLQALIHAYLNGQAVDWIIGDFMTLDFYKGMSAKICYDVHFLGRPFYKALSESKGVVVLDEFHRNHFVLQLQYKQFSFLKDEFAHMRSASCFIVNSKYSERNLLEDYQDVSAGKPITYIPVSTNLELKEESSHVNGVLYFHGRFHPQKGIHFLFNRNWDKTPITIRGFEEPYFTEDRVQWLKNKNISILPWTGDSAQLHRELMGHQAVIFPSIYEPWGLSLQEALALGKICIANRCNGGHEEQITDGVNGFLVDFAKDDIQEKIQEILNLDKRVLEQISLSAKASSKLGHEDRIECLKKFLLEL